MNPIKNRVGEIIESNQCGPMEIVEYKNNSDIKVKFKTGTILKTNYQSFKIGCIKDPLFPNVFEIGFMGIGKYKSSINGKHTIEYKTWQNMLKRCYDPYFINKHLTYQDVVVCDEWLNFQNLAKWHQENYYELLDESVHLDKDTIKIGNKVYSPEFCAFVPQSINNLLIKRDKLRGKCPIGVSFKKENNKYQAKIQINGKTKHLGYFSTQEKAFLTYKIAKEKYIKTMVNKYKDVLDIRIYDSLMQYKISITD